ncbi:MAG: DEAD/DEAH box helicase [Spirochaetes bacterium]|nr:DEAD/DEAH box helicase [Spirochaetota bacterium]
MEFRQLGLHPDLQRGVDDAGYVDCMPVQENVFVHAFKGEDIYAQSQTGTGKTAAFLVSIFQRIMTDDASRNRKVLILAPTRELAVQIEAEAQKLGKYLSLVMGAFYGGVSYGPQFDMLKADVQFIIGTPGRIIDLIQQGKMVLREVGFLVIDEADRMFDMGFIDDLRKLLRYLPAPRDRQTYLFSATLGFRIKNLAWEYMDEPHEIVIEPELVTVELVTQELYHVGNNEKFRVLLGILAREKPKSALIFCNQKFMAEEVSRRLSMNGVDCEFIMGDLPQSKRLEVINKLKTGKLEILVATDVAARGLDIDSLDLVINYDVPMDPESYVHRIGRTARAGKAGKAVTLACEKFVFGLPAIEKYLDNKVPTMPVTDELFVEDKSSGMRFGRPRDRARPGDVRGRHDGRRDERLTRHGAGFRRDGPPQRSPLSAAGAGRPEGAHRPDDRRQRDGPDRAVAQRRPEQADRRPAEAAPPSRDAQGRDPYAMSSEERMKLYRRKYGADGRHAGPERGGERQPDEPGRNRDGGQSRPHGDRRPDEPGRNRDGAQSRPRGEHRPVAGGGTRQETGDRGRAQRTNQSDSRRGSRPDLRIKPQAPVAGRPDVAPSVRRVAAPKPGLLDRLKGLFGGGKKD